jgi:hypothetical protein
VYTAAVVCLNLEEFLRVEKTKAFHPNGSLHYL